MFTPGSGSEHRGVQGQRHDQPLAEAQGAGAALDGERGGAWLAAALRPRDRCQPGGLLAYSVVVAARAARQAHSDAKPRERRSARAEMRPGRVTVPPSDLALRKRQSMRNQNHRQGCKAYYPWHMLTWRMFSYLRVN